MLSFIIYLIVINPVLSLCPETFISNFNNEGCLVNFVEPGPFYGHEAVDISWNSNMFLRETINIRLLTVTNLFNQSNCYYGYTTVVGSDRNDVFHPKYPTQEVIPGMFLI